MRAFLCFFTFLGGLLMAAPASQAGSLSAPGPNPNWTDTQQFEWYLGYMARASNVCGTYNESAVLTHLARMSPYGKIGLGAVMGDGFVGPVCGRINNEARELAGDADEIRSYIEAVYNCTGEECYGQKLTDWQAHDCGGVLEDHLAGYGVEEKDISSVHFTNVRHSGATLDYQARVRLNSCEGALYVHLTDSCKIERDYSRGDCEVAGVARY